MVNLQRLQELVIDESPVRRDLAGRSMENVSRLLDEIEPRKLVDAEAELQAMLQDADSAEEEEISDAIIIVRALRVLKAAKTHEKKREFAEGISHTLIYEMMRAKSNPLLQKFGLGGDNGVTAHLAEVLGTLAPISPKENIMQEDREHARIEGEIAEAKKQLEGLNIT